MPRTIDPDTFGFLASDVARLMRTEFDRRIAAAGIGLTAGEARTLSHAARAGQVRQAVLAELMGVEAMTISGFLDRLEARGLVERSCDPADRRAKLVDLTPDGESVLERVISLATSVREDAARGIPPDAWSALIDGLKSARTNLVELRDGTQRGESTEA